MDQILCTENAEGDPLCPQKKTEQNRTKPVRKLSLIAG